MERWTDRLEAIESILERLRKENEDTPIIVEGRRDEESLRALGFTGEIIQINRGKGIVATCEGLAGTERVILLFDWDRKGAELTKAFGDALRQEGIEYDTRMRSELAILVKKDIKDVQSLYGMLMRLRETATQPAGGQG